MAAKVVCSGGIWTRNKMNNKLRSPYSANEKDKHIKKLITPCYMSEIQ